MFKYYSIYYLRRTSAGDEIFANLKNTVERQISGISEYVTLNHYSIYYVQRVCLKFLGQLLNLSPSYDVQ